VGRRFLITGTDIRVGKTTVGCALGFAFRARGIRVGVMKPVETGCAEVGGELQALDASALALAAGSQLPMELICPYRYRSPLAPAAAAEADDLPPPNLANIARCFHEIAAHNDAVLVESAGGLATPLNSDADVADLAAQLGLEVIVVVGNRLGCLNLAVLTQRHAESHGLTIAGYILCDIDPLSSPAMETNAGSLTSLTSARYLGRMRYREPLSKAIVEQLL
jgi:dethiobiotin synthetase